MPAIRATNPIHRLKTICEERITLAMSMAPFYAAARLIDPDPDGCDWDQFSHLESVPEFRKYWLADLKLREEEQKIHIDLALAWEHHPITLS